MTAIYSLGFVLTVAKHEARHVRRRRFDELTTAAWRLEGGCVMEPMSLDLEPSDVIDPGTFWRDCLQTPDRRCVFESVGGAVRERPEVVAFLEAAAKDYLRRLVENMPACACDKANYLPDYICAVGVNVVVGQNARCKHCHRCAKHCRGHRLTRFAEWLRNYGWPEPKIPF